MNVRRTKTVIDGVFLGTVVVDTREQLPYTFAGIRADRSDGGGPLTVPVRVGTLASGDYSLVGCESLVAVERKSKADLFGTLGKGRDRFERELARLAGYRAAAVVVEATWPEVVTDPPPRSELPPKTVLRSVLAWKVRYPTVHWDFVGPRALAEVFTFRFLERFLKEHVGSDPPDLPPQPPARPPGW